MVFEGQKDDLSVHECVEIDLDFTDLEGMIFVVDVCDFA